MGTRGGATSDGRLQATQQGLPHSRHRSHYITNSTSPQIIEFRAAIQIQSSAPYLWVSITPKYTQGCRQQASVNPISQCKCVRLKSVSVQQTRSVEKERSLATRPLLEVSASKVGRKSGQNSTKSQNSPRGPGQHAKKDLSSGNIQQGQHQARSPAGHMAAANTFYPTRQLSRPPRSMHASEARCPCANLIRSLLLSSCNVQRPSSASSASSPRPPARRQAQPRVAAATPCSGELRPAAEASHRMDDSTPLAWPCLNSIDPIFLVSLDMSADACSRQECLRRSA